MAETLEIIISAVIFLSIFAGIYRKFLKGKLKLSTYLAPTLSASATAPSWISAKFAAAKKDPLSAVFFAAVLLVIIYGVSSYWQNNLASPGRELSFGSQQEFQQNFDRVSGNWQVSGNCLKGSGEIRLKNSEAIKWRKIKISPCEKEFSDATVKVGQYKFDYWKEIRHGNSLGTPITDQYFRGKISYAGVELDPGWSGRVETFGNAPVPVTVISDKSFVYPKSPDLKILAGDTKVVFSPSYLASYAGAPADSPVQGTISFYFGTNAGISKIEIW